MRYTVVDSAGRVSFIASCDALLPLVGACAHNPASLADMLSLAGRYGADIEDYVLSGLAVFDEHNVAGNYERIHAAISHLAPSQVPVFRAGDDITLGVSLQPIEAGAVLFNLVARRIIQFQNTWQEITRDGFIRQEDSFGRTKRVYRYRLPVEWSVTP